MLYVEVLLLKLDFMKRVGVRILMAGLPDLLTIERITVGKAYDDWRSAVRAASSLLANQGLVEGYYAERIITNHQQFGPYMVIAPGIYLAHARPEDGVLVTSASLMTLKPELEFGHDSNDPVWFLFCLAATDNNKHLLALTELTELLMDEEKMQQIRLAVTAAKIWKIIGGNE